MLKNKIYSSLLCCAISVLGSIVPTQANSTFFSFLKKRIFGNVKPVEGIESFEEAAQLFEVEDREYYYTRWPWTYFTTFTLFNDTWISQETWNETDFDEQVFVACHETVHASKKHSLKQLMVLMGTIAVAVYGMHVYASEGIMNAIFDQNSTHNTRALKHYITALGSFLSAAIVTFWYTQQCEKEADIEAIKKLLQEGRKDIVDAAMKRLEHRLHEDEDDILSTLCFGSLVWRIAYFRKTIDQYCE